MILPTITEIKESYVSFIMREQITWRTLLNPARMFKILFRYRFLHFFVTGGTGAAINLGVTWALTTFVFGLENYFRAFLFGIVANLTFNFIIYSVGIFKTKQDHPRRLAVFIIWSIGMTIVQASVVKTVVSIVGVEWYLLVIAGVILFFALVNFLVFKMAIFKERFGL